MGDTAGTRGRACFSAAGRLPCAPPASAPRPLLPPPPLPPPLPLPRELPPPPEGARERIVSVPLRRARRAPPAASRVPGAGWRKGVGVPRGRGSAGRRVRAPRGWWVGQRRVNRGRSRGGDLGATALARRTFSMQPSVNRPADWISSCDTRVGARVRRRACAQTRQARARRLEPRDGERGEVGGGRRLARRVFRPQRRVAPRAWRRCGSARLQRAWPP